jgi:cytochrome b561
MPRSSLLRILLPAIALWAALVAATIAVDVVLHALGWDGVGLWLGPIGTALIVLSFAYSLKKRKRLSAGTPAQLLRIHEVLGWVGTLMVLVHAGIHVNAVLPWAALVSMLIVVFSGLTGSVLLKRAMAELRAKKGDATVLDAAVVDVMKRWRVVHLPLNAVFMVLSVVHIVAALVLRGW